MTLLFIANSITFVLSAYAAVGGLFAVYFVRRGCQRLDERAAEAPLAARLLWAPGALALWPLLLSRCLRPARDIRSDDVPGGRA
jgi:hypothetical protein